MTDEVLSCQEIFDYFSAVTGTGVERPISEGAQNAFVNLYGRLSQRCPAQECRQLADCVLHSGDGPKVFDGPDGKIRYLRMKVRTEGVRIHRRAGSDVLTGTQVELVGGDDWRLGGAQSPEWMAELAHGAALDSALDAALEELATRVGELDLCSIPGGRETVALAAVVAERLVERTGVAPVPSGIDERREQVREVLTSVAPHLSDGSPAAVRQRLKRLRQAVRVVLAAAGGAWFADLWVPLEERMQR